MVGSMGDPAIARFWAFWHDNRAQIEKAIDAGTLMEWVEPLASLVRAIDEDLDWEFGKGRVAAHYFCLSPKGDVVKRAVTERWLAASPAPDEIFEYHPARPGGGYETGQTIHFGEHELAFRDFRFALEVEEPRRRVHLSAWHPGFAEAPKDLTVTATFICLDAVFGEDAVERWIGAIEVAASRPRNATDFPGLVAAVEGVTTAEDGFSLLQGQLPDGSPIFVVARLGLKRLDHLEMDRHLEITIPFASPTEHGLTTEEEGTRLDAAEDVLVERLGADCVYIGRETGKGRRVLHFHVGDGDALSFAKAWASDQPWPVQLSVQPDPEWEVLHRW
jgi:hypothetical protein